MKINSLNFSSSILERTYGLLGKTETHLLALSPAVCESTASDCMATPETTNLCSLGICCLVNAAEVSSVVAATILSSSENDTFGFTPARR